MSQSWLTPLTFWRRPALSERAQAQARIDSKLRAIERQGARGVGFGHALAYLLVVAFSAGSLITLAGDAVTHFLAQAQRHVIDITSLISFVVSFALVFAMDTAMVLAAANVRMHKQRNQPGAGLHLAVIVFVCLVESATYLYMSYVYDHPATVVVWAILVVRAIAAPIVAVYLSLGRTLPISARDINTQVEIVTGRGVLMDMTRIADDAQSTTERKVALYRASAIMDEIDAKRLDAMPRREHSQQNNQHNRDNNNRARREALAAGMFGAKAHPTSPRGTVYDFDDEGDWANTSDLSDLGADDFGDWGDDGPQFRNSVQPQKRSRAQAARVAPRTSEIVLDLPHSKTPTDRGDSDERKRVLRYLDKHPSATLPEVMKGAKVTKATARRHRDAWSERQKMQGVNVASFTQEMPAILPEQLEQVGVDA